MYTVTVPVIGSTITRENRAELLKLLKKAEADRLFIATYDGESPEISENALCELRENIAYFKENGLSVAIWLACTIGHGGTLLQSQDKGEDDGFGRLVDLSGAELYDTHCPYDKNFQEYIGRSVAKYADLCADFILLDDDYRLSQHSGELCCACELHMAKIREYCGEDICREDLKRLAFVGGKNKYRDAWLKAQGESLCELARAIREAVDKVNPDMPIALCSAHSPWDVDGASPIELTDILAGKNKKILRLHGAPYWAFLGDRPIEVVCEMERMFASFLSDRPDIEVISEGDVYPRPRFNVPSSYLEIMDGAMRADGSFDGILKYMISYTDRPLYEQSYIDRHIHNIPKLRAIGDIFQRGANAGVRILARPYLFENSDLDISALRQRSPFPDAAVLLSMCGIPTVYSGEGICSALFGENARHFDASFYKKGAVLDAVSAKILTDKGVDVGLSGMGELRDIEFGKICDSMTGDRDVVLEASATVMCGGFKGGIRPVLTVESNGRDVTLAYCYENSAGQRFLVFTLASDRLPKYPRYLRSYEVQAVLLRELPWVAREEIPACMQKEIEVYTLCEKGDDHTSVALFNCYADSIIAPIIYLDREYSQLECLDTQGHIEGRRVILDTEIPAYGFVAFKAYK